jgi:uncharacterized protein (DUF1778 family)
MQRLTRADLARTQGIMVRVRRDERDLLERAAALSLETLAGFCRAAALELAVATVDADEREREVAP